MAGFLERMLDGPIFGGDAAPGPAADIVDRASACHRFHISFIITY